MTKSNLAIHTLDVPGTRLFYGVRGSGPLLLLLGSPMDSSGFIAMAAELGNAYTVVTYDPRGISNSSSAQPRSTVPRSKYCGPVRPESWWLAGPRPKGSSLTEPPLRWPNSSILTWSILRGHISAL